MANNRGRSTSGPEVLETGKKIATSAGKAVVNEFAESGRTFFEQLVGLKTKSSKRHERAATTESPVAQIRPGVIFTAEYADSQSDNDARRIHHFEKRNEKTEKNRKNPEIRAAIEYHEQFSRQVMDYDRKASERKNRDMDQQIQEIVRELKNLIKSSQTLQTQFTGVMVDQGPVEIGIYHVSFFEWMMIVIKQAKQKVDDAGAWMNTMKGKNGKKSGYWDMFKKHGTSFGLSSERAVATQVG